MSYCMTHFLCVISALAQSDGRDVGHNDQTSKEEDDGIGCRGEVTATNNANFQCAVSMLCTLIYDLCAIVVSCLFSPILWVGLLLM